ncbi:hypothetical protein AZH53_05850 [Methanomicrobiaceae archaeon CYW5]|nr:hypothetical protein [Methanovulcanius yangii]
MVRVTAGVHAAARDEMVAALHEAGVIELQPVTGTRDPGTLIRPVPRSASVPEIAEVRSRLDRAIEILESVIPEPNPITALFGRGEMKRTSFTGIDAPSVLAEAERFREPVSTILSLHSRDIALGERMARLDEEEEMLRLLTPFGIEPGWLKAAELVEVRAGIIPDGECADIEAHLLENVPDLATAATVCGVGDRPTTVVTIAHPDASQKLDAVLRAIAFHEFVPETATGSAEEGIAAVREERGGIRKEQERIHSSLSAMAATHLVPLRAMAEELAIIRDREDAAPLFGKTETITVLEGWAREKDIPRITALCSSSSAGLAFCTTVPATGDDVPAAFDHPRWLAPYGFLTTMFGMPEYGKVDPTVFLAPVLVLTFGLMLGDAGYGILLALIAALLLRGAGHAPGTVRDLAIVLIACGIAGTVFGLLMGSFFGDLLPRVFGVTLPGTLIEPLKDPLSILIIALAIGIAHLNLGLCIAAAEHLREGKVRAMLLEEGTWFCLQPSAAVLILSFFGWGTFSPPVMTAAWAGAALGIGGIMVNEGPLGFFSITGYLGDWLSYARILALALATGGIAMMINTLSGMIAGIGPVFVIVGVIFAVVGHAANLILQSLGGFIHALRLQYVEFFGRFFTAGGRAFAPFAARRKVTEPPGGSR